VCILRDGLHKLDKLKKVVILMVSIRISFLCLTSQCGGSNKCKNVTSIILYLLDVRRMPLTPPKVDMATNMGMMKANDPYIRLAKV